MGRFLQADPFIQAPKNSQSLNRYSYVVNNPLSYTDPSGFNFISKLGNAVFSAFGVVIAIYAPWYAAAMYGAMQGYHQTGTLKGAIIGGVADAAFPNLPRGHILGRAMKLNSTTGQVS